MAKRFGKCVRVCVCVCNELLLQRRKKNIVIEWFNPKINSSTHEDHVIWACWFPVHKCTWKHIKHLNIANDSYRFSLFISFCFVYCTIRHRRKNWNELTVAWTAWATELLSSLLDYFRFLFIFISFGIFPSILRRFLLAFKRTFIQAKLAIIRFRKMHPTACVAHCNKNNVKCF